MFAITFVGCQPASQLRFESRTYGYDFVDETGLKLATAKTLEEVGKKLDDPKIAAKLADPKLRLAVQFYRISPNFKGFQVPTGITCDQIVTVFDRELKRRSKTAYEVNYEN